MKLLRQLLVYTLIVSINLVGLTATAHAAMISTDQHHTAGADASGQTRLTAALTRPDVIAQLEKMGVSPKEAQQRVAALTDTEAAGLASKIETLPAGADILGTLGGIFIILLITDILGFTKVFPFTRSAR